MYTLTLRVLLPNFIAVLGLLGDPALGRAAELDLLSSQGESTVRSNGASVSIPTVRDRQIFRVRTGHDQPWPGITFQAPEGGWDLARFAAVKVEIRNTGSSTATFNVRVDNPGADGTRHCVNGSAKVEPGAVGEVRVPLKRSVGDQLGGKLFGMRGYPVRAGGDGTIDPARVNQFLVFLNHPKVDHRFEVLSVAAEGSYTAPTAWTSDADPFVPFIDTLGQYHHGNWPGKTASPADLVRAREQEAEALAQTRGPDQWNQYGGWVAGPQLESTGFFRVQKHDGRWWLVDPDGRLFWSHGIDCVRMLGWTPIAEREAWFVDPPWEQPEFGEFILSRAYALKGHYAGRSVRSFSFAGANLRRKYGSDWKRVYPEVIHRRLRAWGLNTIANWSDQGVALMRRTPYTDTVGSRGAKLIEGSEGYWGKFPDVFDPSFRESLVQRMTGKQGRSAGDPWCLGYFSDNEMSWGDDLSLALAALVSPPDQPAKQAFLQELQQRYGSIAKLNTAWGTVYANWKALRTSTDRPDAAKAGEDLRAFYARTAECYFRTVKEVIRELAPQQLYLGCRFAWANPLAAAAAAKHCDVVSYNLYRRSVADFVPVGAGDVPLLIGEFHFGALDRGKFHTGLVPVENQVARAEAYTAYVRGALAHPQFVGTHWFQYQDEPTTGRVYDEENYQIGFVDIADTPYPEMIGASRALADDLYRVRLAP